MKYDYLRGIGGGFYLAHDKQKQINNVIDERDVVFYRDVKSADMMSKHYMLVSKNTNQTVLVDIRNWSEVLDDVKSWRTLNSWGRPYIAKKCDQIIETVSFKGSYIAYCNREESGVFRVSDEEFITDPLMAWVFDGAFVSIKQNGNRLIFPQGEVVIPDDDDVCDIGLEHHCVIVQTKTMFVVVNTCSRDAPHVLKTQPNANPKTWNITKQGAYIVFEWSNGIKIPYDCISEKELHFDKPLRHIAPFVGDGYSTCLNLIFDDASICYQCGVMRSYRFGEPVNVTYV